MDVEIFSFGYLHGEPPAAHITLDLRHHFRDPHVSPELRHMNAHDRPVLVAVLQTPGIKNLMMAVQASVGAFLLGPTNGTVTVAVGCTGGRHRAAVFAEVLAAELGGVPVTHRDLAKPVVNRDENGDRS